MALTAADKKFITDLISARTGSADLDLDAPLFPGTPAASWTSRYPSTPATVRNALAFAAYDAHDSEKAIARLQARLEALEARLAG